MNTRYDYQYDPATIQPAVDDITNEWRVHKYEYLPIGPATWARIKAQYEYDEEYTQFIMMAEIEAYEDGEEVTCIVVIPLADDYSSQIDTFLTQVDARGDWEDTYNKIKQEILDDTFWSDR